MGRLDDIKIDELQRELVTIRAELHEVTKKCCKQVRMIQEFQTETGLARKRLKQALHALGEKGMSDE